MTKSTKKTVMYKGHVYTKAEDGHLISAQLTSVAHLCKFHRMVSGQILEVQLDKNGDCEQTIEFKGPDAIVLANEFLSRMGFKPVRITRNILNPNSKTLVIDADTPSYMDPGCEAYHSM